MGRWSAAAIGGIAIACATASARAELPRDYFLNPPPAGTVAHLDAFTLGVQASVENRLDLEQGMSMLQTRISGLASWPYAEGSLNADLRVFLLTLGGSLGYRHVWRDHTFTDPAADRSRDARNEHEENGDYGSQAFWFAEARLRLVVPLSMLFFVNTLSVRDADQNDNSYDWQHANVHDGGTYFVNYSTLFFRHRDFGAIGPALRVMEMPITKKNGNHSRETELAYGFIYATRAGLIRAHAGNADALFVELLAKLGDDEFGTHVYRVPAYVLAAYRATLELQP